MKSHFKEVATPQQQSHVCTLTISLLVSNHIDTIRKCMESIKPILDQVSSELIVVDTVGEADSDGSLAVAKEYANKVVHFDWCNDFAAARNAGLKLAHGEWFLYLDDDEWFDDAAELIEFFQDDRMVQKYNGLLLTVRSYIDWEGATYNDYPLLRCIKLAPGAQFFGKVHECLSPIYAPKRFKQLHTFAHHYGYAGKKQDEKTQRNEKLLRDMIAENPANMHAWRQLAASELGTAGKVLELTAEAIKCYEDNPQEGMRYGEGTFITDIFLYRQDAHTKRMEWQNIIDDAHKYQDQFPFNQSHACIAEYYLFQSYLHLERCAEAQQCVDAFSKDYLWLQKHEEESIDPTQTVLGLNALTTEAAYTKMLRECINLNVKEKNWKNVLHYAESLPWKSNEDYVSAALPDVIEAAYHAQDKQTLEQICSQLEAVEKKLPPIFGTSAAIVKERVDREAPQVTAFLAQLQGDDPCLLVQRALLADGKPDFQKQLDILQRANVNCASPCQELLPLLMRNAVDPTEFVLPLSNEEWTLVIQTTSAYYGAHRKEMLPFIAQTEKVWPICPQRELLLLTLRQRYLFSNNVDDEEEKVQLPAYAENIIHYAEAIYQPQLLGTEQSSLLPGEIRFGFYLKLALDEKANGNPAGFLANLRKGLHLYEAAKPLVKRLAKECDKQQKEAEQASAQMRQLGDQVKVQIQAMLKQGQAVQAAPLVQQLAQLLPDDPEVKALEKACQQ